MRPKSPPCRPQPPMRPPLPTTPKHTPKAGVISIVKPDPSKQTESNETATPSIPHRAAPPVQASKSYQPNESNQTRNSSSSSTPSPSNESRQAMPPVQSMSIQDQDTAAIYEEIDDDVVSSIANKQYFYYQIHGKLLSNFSTFQNHLNRHLYYHLNHKIQFMI